jgi:enoyl-CoA hydratase/carnithine racemase
MSATEAGVMRLERGAELAVLTIDSPPLNLFNRAMWDALREHVGALSADPPRGLLIRAEGKVVSAGVDVHVFSGLDEAAARRLWEPEIQTMHALQALPCPTVFAAHALTLTAAFEMALSCDLLLAARSASFGLVERRVGLTPAIGGTQRLAERAGPARARELVMSGDVYDAETLERWGVVNRVYDDAGFDERARAFAQDLAEGPTLAHAATKRIVQAQVDRGVAGADAVMPEIAAALFATEDLQGAVRSFLADGPSRATFRGR